MWGERVLKSFSLSHEHTHTNAHINTCAHIHTHICTHTHVHTEKFRCWTTHTLCSLLKHQRQHQFKVARAARREGEKEGQGVGQAPCACDKNNIPWYNAQGYTRSMRKQQNTNNSSSAEVGQGALGHSYSFLPDTPHLSGIKKSAFVDILGKAAWSCMYLLNTGTQQSIESHNNQFVHNPFLEDTLQDALKAQPSLLPRRKAVEQLCITSCKKMVHVILSLEGGDGR